MPLHDHRCPVGPHYFEAEVPWDQRTAPCPHHFCEGERVFLKFPAAFVQGDICYDSPIDGRPITSKQARLEDLRRNNCVEYEPGMRQDAERRRRESEAELDRSVDATVEEFFATAPARKLEKLDQELRAGASVEIKRDTPQPN